MVHLGRSTCHAISGRGDQATRTDYHLMKGGRGGRRGFPGEDEHVFCVHVQVSCPGVWVLWFGVWGSGFVVLGLGFSN